MRITSTILFTTLLALCWTGLAVANPEAGDPSLDASDFRSVTNIQLDVAFESVFSQVSRQSLRGLNGPSSMDCSGAKARNGIETCQVTTAGPTTASVPASLAQH